MGLGWYYQSRGAEIGPVSSAQLRQLAAAGKVCRETLVRKDGYKDWVAAGRVRGLFSASEQAVGTVVDSQPSNPPKPKAKPAACPQCRAEFTLADEQVGQSGLCPRCSAQARTAEPLAKSVGPVSVPQSPLQPDLRNCPYCYRLVTGNASSCPYCNKSIIGPVPIVVDQAPGDRECSNVIEPAHGGTTIWLIVAVLLMCTCVLAPVGLIILIIVLFRRHDIDKTVRRHFEDGLRRTRSCGLQLPNTQQTGKILEAARQHLAKPTKDQCLWHVGDQIPRQHLWSAAEAFAGVIDSAERPIALGGPGEWWFLMTMWALYYSGPEKNAQRGACALSNIAGVLGEAGEWTYFARRDGAYGCFSCADFRTRQKDLIAFLDAIPFIFDPPGSVVVELPSERLTTRKRRAILVPERCAGCAATSVVGGLTLTWDDTVVRSAAPRSTAGKVTEIGTSAAVSYYLPGVPVLPQVAGAAVGEVTEAMVSKVSSHVGRWRGKRGVISLRLPCCSGCLARCVGRIHGVGSSSLMLVLYNPQFAAEFKSLNGL